jgi:hypothetical protein
MVTTPKHPNRDFPVLIGHAFGTVIVSLVFCTLAWTIGQQVL